MWQHVKLSDVSLGILPRYSLVVDEDVKKPTNQPNKQTRSELSERGSKNKGRYSSGDDINFVVAGMSVTREELSGTLERCTIARETQKRRKDDLHDGFRAL